MIKINVTRPGKIAVGLQITWIHRLISFDVLLLEILNHNLPVFYGVKKI